MKKMASILLALTMLLGAVACTGGGSTPSNTAGNAPSSTSAAQTSGASSSEAVPSMYDVTEPVTIEFWHNYTNAERAAFLENVCASFNASQEYITVKCTAVGGYPVIAEQVAGALAAGSGLPAISTINYPRVLNYASSEIIEPLGEYFTALDVDLGDYFEGMIEGVSTADGSVYALPFGVSAGVCIYNETVLNEIGKPFPETWEEFKVWCKEVHEITGKVAFGFPYDFNYMNTFFLNVAGIDPLGDGTVSVLDDPKIMKFIYDIKELVDAGYCSWIGATVNQASDDQMAAFALGELIAYTDTSSAVVKIMDSVEFDVNTTIGVTGTSNPAISTASGAALVIYSDNDQPLKNAAFQFAVYLTNAENTANWVIDTCMYPVRKSVVEGGALDTLYLTYPGAQNIFNNADKIIGKNKSPAMQACMESAVGYLGEIVKGNAADIEGTWATAKKEIDLKLADS